ncbi:Protein son of sevenless [Folsomia candida]|uniref:Protein son of sevenless n=1 Tax=Folsomia candida TaxID=158441 RepID=A0A226DD82_FOLCA|nr:Protein son of sevenless [Folsomia candida]
MFPAASTADLLSHSSLDLHNLSFSSTAGDSRWRGLFIPGLRRVLAQTSTAMKAKDDALEYVERLLLQLLGMICSRPYPHKLNDVQDRVKKIFPHPVDEWAMEEAQKTVDRSKQNHGGNKKATNTGGNSGHSGKNSLTSSSSTLDVGAWPGCGIVFPMDKIHPLLKEATMASKLDHSISLYIAAVLEYIAADVLHLVGNYVKHSRRGEFSMQDIKAAVCCDKVLCDLFKLGDSLSGGATEEETIPTSSLTYNEVVEDLLQSERQYLRDLQMLIKVFREQLADKLEKENENLELVFQSIEDITELSLTLVSQVEDTIEMTEPHQVPPVGNCFLELAENLDFDVYDRYAETYDEDCRRMLEELLSRPDVEKRVSTAGRGYVDAVKFYFPKLLLEPFHHCTQYFDLIKLLYGLSPSEKDKTDLLQTDSILTPLQSSMANLNIPKKPGLPGDMTIRTSGKGNKQFAHQKVAELKKLVEGFVDSMGLGYFNEFFCEGELLKISSGRRASERYAFLFDGCIFLCKPNPRSRATMVTGGGGGHFDLRLKEAFYLSRVEVHDKEDGDEWKNLFEVAPRDQQPILLSCRTHDEKRNWMAILVMLTTKSMLDRLLDRILSDEEKKHPLKLPPSDKYRFAVPDSEKNIVFDKDNGNHFIIKGATLLKLVERLTHHQYSDPSFVNTFLTTYRSFCSPHEFLELLIERFNIPDPQVPPQDAESIHAREMLKRFRKEYSRHIQLRVLNVIKQWVMHHFYDFERDPTLQSALEAFLETADEGRGKNCIFESVRRCLRKASPPPIEYHIRCPVSEWNILTFHPIELARQLSLLEFDYYRVVKPSELVGSVWTKKNKEQQSPNLLKMIKHTTSVTRWFEKTIVDTENIDERVAVVSRILEVMIVMMQELNNFNGVLAVVSAMGSASVHRLSFTFQSVSARLLKALEDAQELQNDHYKKYQERLRSINPPCVPFFGMYLTNILHIEEGNLDFLPNSPELINFGKRRKVAEITSEIRQFQYSHYCHSVEPKIREYIERLQPFPPDFSEYEIANYLYEKSLEIEPRGAKGPPKFPRKWPDLPLKSPGIKRNGRIGMHHPGPLHLPFSSLSQNSLVSLASSRTLNFTPDSSDPLLESAQPQAQRTPKTPSSVPSTSSPQDNYGDFSIFAPVLIGSVPHPQMSSSYPAPPPVPPRPARNRQESTGDTASISPARVSQILTPITTPHVPSTATNADSLEMPPPLPPRKVSPRTPNPPIPRRNSAATNSELSPLHVNHPLPLPPPHSPNRRLIANGPQSQSPSTGAGGLTSCASEHNTTNNSRFHFSPAGNNGSGGGPCSPGSRPAPLLPTSPPKLPPKASKPIHNP